MASASGIYSEPGTALIASPTDFKREPLRLHVTLAQQLRPHAPGLTPRSVIDKFAAIQMLDVEIPTTDGQIICLTRYTEPEPELRLLLAKLRLELPAQPPPKITAAQAETATLV